MASRPDEGGASGLARVEGEVVHPVHLHGHAPPRAPQSNVQAEKAILQLAVPHRLCEGLPASCWCMVVCPTIMPMPFTALILFFS